MKRVLLRPAAQKTLERDRDLVEAGFERFATSGQGDVKMLKGRNGSCACDVPATGEYGLFMRLLLIRVLHIKNRNEAY